jgi:hypothetical protein
MYYGAGSLEKLRKKLNGVEKKYVVGFLKHAFDIDRPVSRQKFELVQEAVELAKEKTGEGEDDI